MNNILSAKAEKQAEQAEKLKAFAGLKIAHIKEQVTAMLKLIGRDGIFDEYTKHDISHINAMLDSLEYIIPDQTQNLLSPSEWLMITLSIYFHDLGMLVTKDEYENRNNTPFASYSNEFKCGGLGSEYKSQIESLPAERRERFIYQEFVRKHHAERIKYWVQEECHPNFGSEHKIVNEVKKLLDCIDPMFRRDLACICESHMLNDLDDFDKYKPMQQYGPTDSQKVNLHYCALILRTADLLHITSDRTPSIEYRLINPNDPVSQDEWAKQGAVKVVRPKNKIDKEGNIAPELPKDTLEVIAHFNMETGYFGLMSYLKYATEQLRYNHKINESAKKRFSTSYDYPWRDIDDSQIVAESFEKRQFEFTIDQKRILDLLIGHTLYNDSTVVLRELIQNSIDATRLKMFECESLPLSYMPKIKVTYNKEQRTLSFIDNGTGMNIDIIENHLLNVGSSRYQDDDFKKHYPSFSPISRFGIGLLTCFLIADDIDIITKDNESEKAINLMIRKIHGKYLLKYVSKEEKYNAVWPHGTQITLHVRSDVNLENIEHDLRKWIVVPATKIILDNNGSETEIGYNSPKDVLLATCASRGINVDGINYCIKEECIDGITVAYALQYNEYYQEWSFVKYNVSGNESFVPTGVCVEGIRVDFTTPGFSTYTILALANCKGKNAPKTNVARSNIEITQEKSNLLSIIYSIYIKHVVSQINALSKSSYSLTWAADEVVFLLKSFFARNDFGNSQSGLEDKNIFMEELSRADVILVEADNQRKLYSLEKLKSHDEFWTIDCASYTSADSLLREVNKNNISALLLLKQMFDDSNISMTDHISLLWCNQKSSFLIDELIGNTFQIKYIKIIPEQRRLDFCWTKIDSKIWEEIKPFEEDTPRYSHKKFYIQLQDGVINDDVKHNIIISKNIVYVLKNSILNTYLIELINKFSAQEDMKWVSLIVMIVSQFIKFPVKDITRDMVDNDLNRMFSRGSVSNYNERALWEKIDRDKFIDTLVNTKLDVYNSSIWYRRYYDEM